MSLYESYDPDFFSDEPLEGGLEEWDAVLESERSAQTSYKFKNRSEAFASNAQDCRDAIIHGHNPIRWLVAGVYWPISILRRDQCATEADYNLKQAKKYLKVINAAETICAIETRTQLPSIGSLGEGIE